MRYLLPASLRASPWRCAPALKLLPLLVAGLAACDTPRRSGLPDTAAVAAVAAESPATTAALAPVPALPGTVRNGVEIARSTVSTGRPGHATPTGVFQILQKQRRHYSDKYNSAPMPYMERLTWNGSALHAGNLSGYPASHGCVRLPLEFAKLLYGVTSSGGTVVIADERHGGANLAHPGFIALAIGADTAAAADTAGTVWAPERAPAGPVAIVVSSGSREVHVFRNGVQIGRAPIRLVDPALPLVPASYVRTETRSALPHPFAPASLTTCGP